MVHRGKKVWNERMFIFSGTIPSMPSAFTGELLLLLLFVQSLKFAHVWMHKLNTFIMPDLLLCKPPAINTALMRSVTDIFYSMRHLYRLLYWSSWIIIIYNLSLSISSLNMRDEVRLRTEMALPPIFIFLLRDGKWQKNPHECICASRLRMFYIEGTE